MRKCNLYFGSFLLVFSVVLYVTALLFPGDLVSATGPGFFPKIVSVLMTLLSLCLIWREVREYRRTKEIITFVKWENWKRVAAIMIDMVFYVMMLNIAGFLISTFFFLIIMLFLMEPTWKKWWLKALMAVFLTGIVYMVFAVIFGASLPQGWLG